MVERDIFVQVIQIADPAERAALIEEACGDDAALRQRAATLLEAHERAVDFLESPPSAVAGSPTIDRPPAETLGMHIVPYKLLQQLGGSDPAAGQAGTVRPPDGAPAKHCLGEKPGTSR